jgi:hypothetical protein
MELTDSSSEAVWRSKTEKLLQPIFATVDANVNDYLKVKMHLLKTIQMVRQPQLRFY